MSSTKPQHPYSNASPASRLFLWWTRGVFRNGYSRDFLEEDLFSVLPENQSDILGDRLERRWQEEVERSKRKESPSLLRAIVKTFWLRFFFYGILVAVDNVCIRTAIPFLLGKVVQFFGDDDDSTISDVYMYAAALIVAVFADIFLRTHYFLWGACVGMRVRVASCSLIYRKILRLNKFSMENAVTGKIINLLSNDVSRFDVAGQYFHWMWVGALQVFVIAYYLYSNMGLAALAGIATIIITTVPVQGYLGHVMATLRKKIAQCSDKRMGLMSEIISGIRVIKMYTWEKPFEDLVALTRQCELTAVAWAAYLRGFYLSSIVFSERFAIFITLLVYWQRGHTVLPYQVFALTQFYNFLNVTLALFYPMSLSATAESLVSIKRLQNFLLKEESSSSSPMKVSTGQVTVSRAHANWSVEQKTLINVSLDVTLGQLCGIVGCVGSGKSSLLHLLLGELPLLSGSVGVGGRLSYATQEPWVFVGSVRQNILFGQPYNTDKYRQVVDACALRADLDQLPNGDQTLVGEKGITLSGGQKARINLARAVYKDADVYILDDPLSAVDTIVGKHLFDECINGYLKKKTRILVTHQLQYLMKADKILILEKGEIKCKGKAEVILKSEKNIVEMLAAKEDGAPEVKIETKIELRRDSGKIPSLTDLSKDCVGSGTTTASHYWQYLKAGGGCCFVSIVVSLLVLTQVIRSGADVWITKWTNSEANIINGDELLNEDDISGYTYLVVYGCLVICCAFTAWSRAILFLKLCMRATSRLHNAMFSAMLGATMHFFDTNPSGNILNRFSKDVGAVDELLPYSIVWMTQMFLIIFGSMIVIVISNYYLALPVLLIACAVVLVTRTMLRVPRKLKALESRTRGPALAHLSDSLRGMVTIRAAGAQKQSQRDFDSLQDVHTSAWFWFVTTTAAFGFCLDFLVMVLIALALITFIGLGQDKCNGSDVGLAISQALALTGMLQTSIMQLTEVVSHMTSVSRMLEYTSVEQESTLESIPDRKPPALWPWAGSVQFKGVSLSYSDISPPILRDLNFVIKPKHKVGIVGRTGAGKSSLITALFRLAPVDGSVLIDCVDTGLIDLHDLRRQISSIPQDPALFSATLRFNLDPFQEFQDAQLWEALKEVELDVESLNWQISEGGSNLSVGQRQLLCLARASLRNNRLLVLDEATANVDPETDALIQKTIRRKFKDCTVITIAHRINTIIDSDMVMVMDAGMCVEYDHPRNLLLNREGHFFRMVQETGKEMAYQLTAIAEQAYWTGQEDDSPAFYINTISECTDL